MKHFIARRMLYVNIILSAFGWINHDKINYLGLSHPYCHCIPVHGMIARRKNLIIRKISFHMERSEYASISDGESPGGEIAPRRDSDEGEDALACLPTYLEFGYVMGLNRAIENRLEIRSGEQGWSDAETVMALILLNLAGGEGISDLDILEGDEGFLSGAA